MATPSLLRLSGSAFAALAMLLVGTVLLLHVPAVEAAEPVVPARGSVVRTVGAARTASRHILVQLHPHTDEVRFL